MWTPLANYAMGWIMFNFLEEIWVILTLETNSFHSCIMICHTHGHRNPLPWAALIGPQARTENRIHNVPANLHHSDPQPSDSTCQSTTTVSTYFIFSVNQYTCCSF